MSDTHVLTVPDMTCGHCTSAVETEVGAVEGVRSVEVDLDTKLVTVVGGARDAIVEAIDDAGFDVAD